MVSMKAQKIAIIISLVVIGLTMLLPWFGFARGIQEIQGFSVCSNPLMLLFLLGIGTSLVCSKQKTMNIVALIGFVGVFAMEIYTFLTWHILTITGEFSLSSSLEGAYPEFYVALGIACIPVVFQILMLATQSKKKYTTIDPIYEKEGQTRDGSSFVMG